MAETRSTTRPAESVPFIGWSTAAARFRKIALQLAPGGKCSVLFVGQPGVGKKAMAGVWNHLSGQGAKLPIINLDSRREPIPHPCIAYSERPLPENASCTNLSGGPVPASPAGSEESNAIPQRKAASFQHHFYVPPLADRPADTLAILHYLNVYLLPKVFGASYERISEVALGGLLASEWSDNILGLRNSVLASADRDHRKRVDIGESATSEPVNLGTLEDTRTAASSQEKKRPRTPSDSFGFRSAIAAGEVPQTRFWHAFEKVVGREWSLSNGRRTRRVAERYMQSGRRRTHGPQKSRFASKETTIPFDELP